MKNTILTKCVVNKVNFEGQTYLRLYTINQENELKGTFMNLKVFLEIKPSVFVPFYYEECDNNELKVRLMTTNVNEDISVDFEEIERYLTSIDRYLNETHDVVQSICKSLMPEYEMIVYKEYMGVFYVILSNNQKSLVYEVRLDMEGKLRLLYLEKNMASFIVTRDLCRFIADDIEMYLQVGEDRYMIITNITEKQCIMDIDITDENKYNLRGIKFNSSIPDENVTLALGVIKEKIEHIAKLREK